MDRRNFIRDSALLATSCLIPVKLLAQDSRLAEDSAQATALSYTSVSQVQNQNCRNCLHALGDLGNSWVGCRLFPGKLVAAAGWCKMWAPT